MVSKILVIWIHEHISQLFYANPQITAMLKSFKTTKLTSSSPRDKVHRSSTPAYVRDRTGVFAFKNTHQNKNPRVSKHAVQYLTRKSCDLNRICSLKLLLKATNMTWSFWQLWQIRFHLPESQPCSFNCNYGHIMIPMLGKAPSHGARQRNKALLQINLFKCFFCNNTKSSKTNTC